MKPEVFRKIVKRMDVWAQTNDSEEGRKLDMLQRATNFPLTMTKKQSKRWNELFHGKWKGTTSTSVQRERRL